MVSTLGRLKVLVSRIDMLLQSRQLKTIDRKHGCGCTLTTFHRVADKARLESQYGEGLLAAHTAKEKPVKGFLCVGVEGFIGAGGGYRDGRDETLRMASSAIKLVVELARSQTHHLADNKVLNELS